MKLIALQREFVPYALCIFELAIVSKGLPVKDIEFIFQLADAAMRRILLLLEVLAQCYLLVQVVFQLFSHVRTSITVIL